ncbi:RNA polymerase factor sigma-54 [Anaerosinus massiliensis]|uniref:RNA polymerase factor sigma-54 n=1 Tax=Massilibacillus massiliensis TaxID=1806837 RepID=UPI000B0A1E3A|nr:RNA polymerase factor sigma-54 [Massilibacillus massiliensis]
MEQNLSLQLGQKLAMTAQLQQAIRILQLSAQDLRALIDHEYLENPALEMDETHLDNETTEKLTDQFSFDDIRALANYLGDETAATSSVVRDETKQSFEAVAVIKPTLEEVLEEQVNLTFSHVKENEIAKYIIGSMNDKGYLTCTIEEISKAMNESQQRIEQVLTVIQTFEPAGVGARNLRECLTIQAKQQGIYHGLVAAILEHYLDQIAHSQYKNIADQLGCLPSDIQLAVDMIRSLNPKPGLAYSSDQADYIVPDVVVRKIDDAYIVLVNDYGIPRLNISNIYKNASNFDQETKKYIEGRVNSAAWLIKSIEQRRNTLYNVVHEIVELQREFFDRGPKFIKPMVMKTVADRIEVHESTVSRSVANKYVETPHGVMSLKSFFNANLSVNGEELVAGQVKAKIKAFIEQEDSKKPLSDQQISELLKAENMTISRRTVMKYREQLGFLSSVKRKRY